MKYEIVMLRGIKYCKESAVRLAAQCKKFALESYNTEFWHDGTMGQFVTLSKMVDERDRLIDYLIVVKQTLRKMKRRNAALLQAVYIRSISKDKICEKLNVSIATLYRMLAKAHDDFRRCLISQDFDEDWFRANYNDMPWIAKLLASPQHGARIAV